MGQTKAFIKQLQGITFTGKTDSNFWITMDGPENFGGSDAGIRPGVSVHFARRQKPICHFETSVYAGQSECTPKENHTFNLPIGGCGH